MIKRAAIRLGVGLSVLGAMLSSTPSYADVVVTYDLRVAGTGAKYAFLFTPSQIVKLEVFALITNLDGDHSNDGIAFSSLRFISTEYDALLFGDYQNPARAPLFDGPLGGVGTPANLDANPDMEWGTTSNTSPSANFNPHSAPMNYGSGLGTGPTEFLLGSIEWKLSGGLRFGSEVLLNVEYFENPGTTRGQFTLTSDGTLYSQPTFPPGSADSFERVGTPVVVLGPIPEPGTLSIASALGTLLMRRRAR